MSIKVTCPSPARLTRCPTTYEFSYLGSGLLWKPPGPLPIPTGVPITYLGRDIFDIEPSTIPADTTPDEWKAYLSRLHDFLGALLTRPDLPAHITDRIVTLRASIVNALT